MEIAAAMITPFIPALVDIIKDAWAASKGDTQVFTGILLGILGTTEDNASRAAVLASELRALKELGPPQTPK